MKSVQIRSFFWSLFSHIRTGYGEIQYLSVFSPNAGKYGTEKTPYLDTFHAVFCVMLLNSMNIHVKITFNISKHFLMIHPICTVANQQMPKMNSTLSVKNCKCEIQY